MAIKNESFLNKSARLEKEITYETDAAERLQATRIT
jgi:hypothetical protein